MSRFSMYLTVIMLGWASLPAMMAAVELKQDDQSDQVILSNEIVSIALNMSNGMYTITDIESGQIIIDLAGVAADSWGNADGMRFTWKQEEINDALGHGRRLMVEMEQQGNRAIPVYLFSFALYDGRGGVFMGFGMRNTMQQGARLMRVAPMLHARLLEGKPLTGPQTLNGAAGADIPRVEKGLTRACPNSLLLTCMADGIRLSLVWGGLANREFGKWVALRDGKIEMLAEDPVGRLVDLANVKWEGREHILSGLARVIGSEPFKIVVAVNGSTAKKIMASGGRAKLSKHPADGLVQIILERPDNGEVSWQLSFE